MRKNLISWLLYDAGNSFLTASLSGMFLAQLIVIEYGFDDIWYGGAFSLATAIVLILSPFLGAWSDIKGKRLPFIKYLTYAMYLLGIPLVIAPLLKTSILTKVLILLSLYVLIQVLYQLSLIFYNTLAVQLTNEKNRGKIVGLGEAFGEGGWLLAVGFLLLFTENKLPMFGPPGYTRTFLPAYVIFLLLTIPLLLIYKEKTKRLPNRVQVKTKAIYKTAISGIKDLYKTNKNVGLFLLGFAFVSDAIQTAVLYFAIIFKQLYKLSDINIYSLLVIMQLFAVFGSYFLGKVCDNKGKKKVLIVSCTLLAISFFLIFASSSKTALFLTMPLVGLGFGGHYVAARSLLIRISPKKQLAEYFGFYSTFRKLASIVGPLLWGLVTYTFAHLGPVKYKFGGFSLLLLLLVGIYFLNQVQETKTPNLA